MCWSRDQGLSAAFRAGQLQIALLEPSDLLQVQDAGVGDGDGDKSRSRTTGPLIAEGG